MRSEPNNDRRVPAGAATLTGGAPVRLAGMRVSAELFSTLGVPPAMGRWLRTGEDASPNDRFAVLSYSAWQTRFGSDPDILRTSIELDGQAHEVVAVMPASFEFPSRRTEVWVPLGLDPRNTTSLLGRRLHADRRAPASRSKPGGCSRRIRLFQSRIGARFPWQMPADWNQDVSAIRSTKRWSDVNTIHVMLAAVAAVLVIACANVANLPVPGASPPRISIRTAPRGGAATRRAATATEASAPRSARSPGAGGRGRAVDTQVVLPRHAPDGGPRAGAALRRRLRS